MSCGPLLAVSSHWRVTVVFKCTKETNNHKCLFGTTACIHDRRRGRERRLSSKSTALISRSALFTVKMGTAFRSPLTPAPLSTHLWTRPRDTWTPPKHTILWPLTFLASCFTLGCKPSSLSERSLPDKARRSAESTEVIPRPPSQKPPATLNCAWKFYPWKLRTTSFKSNFVIFYNSASAFCQFVFVCSVFMFCWHFLMPHSWLRWNMHFP